ncbi:unnamed protein product, partial [Mesorhabditis spiculigera]
MASSRRLWAALQGVICVHKPADTHLASLKKRIIAQIVEQGNQAWEGRPPKEIELPIVTEGESGAIWITGTKKQPDYSEHPLVVGPMLHPQDVLVEELGDMEPTTSGICLLGLNDGCEQLPGILERAWPSRYRLEGILGRQTVDNEIKGRVMESGQYEPVSRGRMQKVISKMLANFRRLSFELSGVDAQSEAAFEMARKGIPRPSIPGQLLVQKMDLAVWAPPYFALDLTCSGETDATLRNFVLQIGGSVGTVASPTKLIRLGVGPFLPEHALLWKQLNLQNIVRNIAANRKMLTDFKADQSPVFEEAEPVSVVKGLLDTKKLNSADDEEVDAMRPYWGREYEK